MNGFSGASMSHKGTTTATITSFALTTTNNSLSFAGCIYLAIANTISSLFARVDQASSRHTGKSARQAS